MSVPPSVDVLVNKWLRAAPPPPLIYSNDRLLKFLGDWLYADYQPVPEKPAFRERLSRWLDILPGDSDDAQRNADQQTMFNFVPWLLYAAQADMLSIARAAYSGPVTRWLIDTAKVAIDSASASTELRAAEQDTWFASLAGADIGLFCRINNLSTQDVRLEMRFLASIGDAATLTSYLKKDNPEGRKYKRIVIVEDIVGTGTQLASTSSMIKQLSEFDILIVPFFIVPQGLETALSLFNTSRHVQFTPLYCLPEACLIRRYTTGDDPPPELSKMSELVDRSFGGDFGYNGLTGHTADACGTLMLQFSNCPDTVPPVIHSGPCALFPRANRGS